MMTCNQILRVGAYSLHPLLFIFATFFTEQTVTAGSQGTVKHYRSIVTSTLQGGLLPGRPVTDTLYYEVHFASHSAHSRLTISMLRGAEYTDHWISRGTVRRTDTMCYGVLNRSMNCVSYAAPDVVASRQINYDFALPFVLRGADTCGTSQDIESTLFTFYTTGVAKGMFYFDTLIVDNTTYSRTDSNHIVAIVFKHSRRLHMDMTGWETGNDRILDFLKSGTTRVEYLFPINSIYPSLIVGTSNLRGVINGLPVTLDPEIAAAMRQTSLESEIRMELIE